jgi:rhomboid protease GluP
VNSRQNQCAGCGTQIDNNTLSGDFCSECADKVRSELALSFQFNQIWVQIREGLTRLPIVTFLLVSINVAVYCLVNINSDWTPGPSLSLVLEMRGISAIQGQWWRLLTSAFLHLNFGHLSSNVVFLLFLGWMAESLFGHLRLLVLWTACGIGASIAALAFLRPNSVSLGASGVVYGLIGALLCVHVFKQRLHPARFRYLKIVLLICLLVILLDGDWYFLGRFVPAHVGGLLTGFLFAFVIPLANRKTDGRQELLAKS